MKYNGLIYAFSYVLTVLFCWVIFPIKWIKKAVYNAKKQKNIAYANEMHAKTGRKYIVVQNGTEMYVGTRKDFRLRDAKMKRKLYGYLKWDYRNGIIYETK